jgi:hypothetical protein
MKEDLPHDSLQRSEVTHTLDTIELARRHLVKVNEQAAVFVSDPKGNDFTRRLHPYNLFCWTFIRNSPVIYCSMFGNVSYISPPILCPFQVSCICVGK